MKIIKSKYNEVTVEQKRLVSLHSIFESFLVGRLQTVFLPENSPVLDYWRMCCGLTEKGEEGRHLANRQYTQHI